MVFSGYQFPTLIKLTDNNRAKKWDASKHTAFNNNIDKEKLNGLYNEIVNTLIDDIDKDKSIRLSVNFVIF